jgi:hypothetical protein
MWDVLMQASTYWAVVHCTLHTGIHTRWLAGMIWARECTTVMGWGRRWQGLRQRYGAMQTYDAALSPSSETEGLTRTACHGPAMC